MRMNGTQETRSSLLVTTSPDHSTSKKNKSSRWNNYGKRLASAISSGTLFIYTLYSGQPAILLMSFIVELICFSEAMEIGFSRNDTDDPQIQRALSYWFFFCFNVFFNLPLLNPYLSQSIIPAMLSHHKLASLVLYAGGLSVLVVSVLNAGSRRVAQNKFYLMGWTHMCCHLVVIPANLLTRNIGDHIAWFLIPCVLVNFNDASAFICGRYFGRTSLTMLSPNKTWEGWIGAGIATLLLALGLEFGGFTPSPGFSISLAAFCSVIGPFGGFFASGLKRAVGIKDFGRIMPGHGGLLDRCDCLVLSAFFSFVYHSTFHAPFSPQRSLYNQVLNLEESQQLQLYMDLLNR